MHAEFDGKEDEELEALNIEVALLAAVTRHVPGGVFRYLQDVGGRIRCTLPSRRSAEGICSSIGPQAISSARR